MNAYSILQNYDNVKTSDPNYQLIQNSLAAKQNKIDTNRAKLQNLYDQFSMLKVHNDVDQEYIENRLESVRDIANKYANMDLSDSTFATSLMANVSQVLDEKVKNAVVSTKLIEAEDAQWAKAKAEKPDTYSDLNRSYALSKSDRGSYENAQEAGAVYRGGAGFIEYRDLSKKLMENIPKLQDMLKAEWIETGPGQGYFQSQDTYESIPRDKMNQALELVFDEKDKKQIRINGWGEYDQVPDEVLKEEWDNKFQPEIEDTNERIQALEDLKRDPLNKDKIAEIDATLAQYQNKKADLENYTFENMYKTVGREGVYTTLYNSKFKDQILDSYSYEPRLIDRKIDEVQKANVEFQHKLQQEEEKNKQWEMDYALRYSKEAREQMKFEAEFGGAGGAGQNASDFNVVDYQEVTKDASISSVEEFTKEQDTVIRTAKNTLKSIVGRDLTNKEFQEVSRQLSPGNVDPDEVAQITIGGKKYDVDMNKYYDRFLNLYNYGLNDSPYKKEYTKDLKNAVWQTASDLGKLSVRGTGAVNEHLPNIQVKIVQNKKGGFEVVKNSNPNTNYYAYLVNKKGKHDANSKNPGLTPAEVKTLEMYTSMSLIMDDEQEPKHTKGVYRFMADETLKGVNTNGYLLTYDQIKTKGANTKNKKVIQVLNNAYEKDDLSDMGYYDTNYRDKQGKNTDLGDYETRLQKRLKSVDERFERRLEPVYAEKQVSVMSTQPKTHAHNVLTEIVSAKTGLKMDHKYPIRVERVYGEGGKIDPNFVQVSYTDVRTKDGVKHAEEKTMRVESSILQKRGVAPFGSTERTPYRAELGESAALIPLGNNSISNTKKQIIRSKNGGLPTDKVNADFYRQLNPNQGQAVKSIMTDYQKGSYIFKIEPVQGNYHHTVSKRNKDGELEIIHLDPTPVGPKIYEGEVKTLTTNSYVSNETLLLDFIANQIENL